jgi:FKBP-type peptidyl-prolyl cis-trans isomerase
MPAKPGRRTIEALDFLSPTLIKTPMMITHRIAALCAAAALALPSTPAIAAKPKAAAKPVLTCKVTAADGLSYTVIKSGKGAMPTDNDRVTVNYRGVFKSDGSEFDAGKATQFKVTRVVPGFSQGLKLMQAGGKYRLCIPSALGYGADGYGSVPANADLVFEVEMLSFAPIPPKPSIAADARACNLTSPSGLSYAVARQGAGRTPTEADMALVDIVTFDPNSGEIFAREDWQTIPMQRAAPQFAEGLKLMQPGASYRFCFPASEGPQGQQVPALNLVVDLIDLRLMPAVED